MVRRYVSHMGNMIPISEDDSENAWKGFQKYTLSEDYAALEAKAIKAGFAAGEYILKINKLEAELRELKEQMADAAQERRFNDR